VTTRLHGSWIFEAWKLFGPRKLIKSRRRAVTSYNSMRRDDVTSV
jgi:hypothetical protein